MLGNVWEWCFDWYGPKYYRSSPAVDPAGARNAASRVTRGGCWKSLPWFCRPAYRNWSTPDRKARIIGFRVAAFQD
jgi:formylglycine-generating enzyme required for sulfatase activity